MRKYTVGREKKAKHTDLGVIWIKLIALKLFRKDKWK